MDHAKKTGVAEKEVWIMQKRSVQRSKKYDSYYHQTTPYLAQKMLAGLNPASFHMNWSMSHLPEKTRVSLYKEGGQ